MLTNAFLCAKMSIIDKFGKVVNFATADEFAESDRYKKDINRGRTSTARGDEKRRAQNE